MPTAITTSSATGPLQLAEEFQKAVVKGGDRMIQAVTDILKYWGYSNPVKQGLCREFELDQDGSRLGSGMVINEMTKITVLCQYGYEDLSLTKTIELLYRKMANILVNTAGASQQTIDGELTKLIEEGRQLEPILIGNHGQLLGEPRRWHSDRMGESSAVTGTMIHTRDNQSLPAGNGGGATIGIHVHCGGELKIYRVSATHRDVVCTKCQHRLNGVPEPVVTYGDLRQLCNTTFCQAAAQEG